ncbi:MAG: cytochrome C [Betaproteobacteria bacterium HGW-Betaproteobacteria-13]|jgi:cytochrome c556|uniref:Cytochrome C n=1 Tax=Parazoarcus communis TaxID=41977 RepID=A0A2U8H2I6_9RHOO|nr:cytochrome c [Parazoarcus communis]AWI78915.1 cytochrome C [Parazoarcus communis]PKO79964.1 MAG: cytochrome C [Betaproteobacteria bacterium HGW-Betaproteobacteria-13]
MKKSIARAALGIVALSLATMASAQVKPEDQIKFRKAGYSFMSWNMGKIKNNLEGTYDAAQVTAAANAIAGIANSGMGALYGPGTDKAIGDQKTRVKPELFQNMPEVGKLAGDFNSAANNLAKVAASGDAAAVKTAFGDLGKTCKACHDKFREE